MKKLILLAALAATLIGQGTQTRWSATTGQVTQTGASYTATIQQPTGSRSEIYLDQIVVYCSVACLVTQSAFGTAATTTVTGVQALLPTQPSYPVPVAFFTNSNVGAGTQQGGSFNMLAGQTQPFCLGTACGNPGQVIIPTSAGANYSVTVNAITGTSNITFFGRSPQ